MNECDRVQAELIHLLSGNVAGRDARALEHHLAGCPRCTEEKRALEMIWQGLKADQVETPLALREKTLALVYREARAELSSAWRLGPLKIAGGVVAGALMTLLSFLLLRHEMDLTALSSGSLFICAILWGGVFITAFFWMLGRFRLGGLLLGAASSVGLIALTLSLSAAYLCPKLHVIAWWRASIPGAAVEALLGEGGTYFALGVTYSLLPTFLASLLFGRSLHGDLWKNGLVSGFSFFLLLLPALYLQCTPFALGILVSWSAGTLVGALAGVFGGLGFYRLSASSA